MSSSPSINITVNASCRSPEARPHWTIALKDWGIIWDLHVYGFGSIFVLLALVTCCLLCRLCYNSKSSNDANGGKSTLFKISLYLMLLGLCVTRFLHMFTDAYGSRTSLPCVVSLVLWSLGWPCLTTSYSILLLALLETTRIYLTSPKFQKASVIAVITALQFTYLLVSDVVVAYFANALLMIVFCEILFIVWDLLLTVGYLYVALKIRSNLFQSRPNQTPAQKENLARTCRLTRIIFANSAVSILLVYLHIYSALELSMIIKHPELAPHWTWLLIQTASRSLEIIVAALILATITNVRRKQQSARQDRRNLP